MLQACEVLFAQNRPSRRWFLYIVSAARVLLVQNFIIVTDSVNLNLSRSDINSRLVHLIWLIKAGANAQRLFIFIHIHPTVVVQQIAKSCSGHRMQVRLTRFDLVRLLPTGRASNPSRGGVMASRCRSVSDHLHRSVSDHLPGGNTASTVSLTELDSRWIRDPRTAGSLMWTLVLLSLLFYSFGVILTQIATSALRAWTRAAAGACHGSGCLHCQARVEQKDKVHKMSRVTRYMWPS